MTAALLRLIFSVTLCCLPVISWSAEAARLRYNSSVYGDDKGVGLRHPEGIACNEKAVVVGDTENDRLLRYVLEEKTLKAGTEIKIPQLTNPIRVQINSKGEIFALDGKQRRIVRLNADGTFKGYIAIEGVPTDAPVIPRSFKISRDDTLYILDVFSGRVLVLNPEGKFQKQIDFPKEYGFFSDLAIDPKGNVLLIDSIKARVFSAAKNSNSFSPLGGPLKEYLDFPVSITTDSRGTIYVTDENGAAIGVLAQDGSFLGKQLSMGWSEGLLYYPSQICVNEKGEVFIADRGNSRVQLFTVVK
jgi:DNA-binding beta-propeller fold protein YncE